MGKNTKNINCLDLLNEFLFAKQADGVSEETIKNYRYHAITFLKFIRADKKPVDYETIHQGIIRYFSQPFSAGYRNIKLRHLKVFFNWCVREGYLPTNPVEGIKKAKEDFSNIRHAPLEDLHKLLKQPDQHTYTGLRDYCLMLVQLDTGARPSELFRVKPSDLNLTARELYIRPEVSKTCVGRTLILSVFTTQALVRFLKVRPQWWGSDIPIFATETGKPLDRYQWAYKVRKYCQQAGVKVTPYGLRHSFAIEFLKAGGDPFSLQRLLGHTDLTMTRRYIRLSQDYIKQAHEKASPVQKLQNMSKRAPRRLNNTQLNA